MDRVKEAFLIRSAFYVVNNSLRLYIGIAIKYFFTSLQILSVIVRIIQRDAEEKKVSFNPRPYFRLFINLLSELTTSDLHHDSANFQVHVMHV